MNLDVYQEGEESTTNATQSRRSQRERQFPQRLNDYEVFPNTTVTTEGDLVHFTLFAEAEPVNFEHAM